MGDNREVRDEGLRSSCFSSLAVLCAQFGDDVPYAGGLDRGFAFRGQRVPFLNRQQGIFRAAAQTRSRRAVDPDLRSTARTTIERRRTGSLCLPRHRSEPSRQQELMLRQLSSSEPRSSTSSATRVGLLSAGLSLRSSSRGRPGLRFRFSMQPGAMRGPLDDAGADRAFDDPIERALRRRQETQRQRASGSIPRPRAAGLPRPAVPFAGSRRLGCSMPPTSSAISRHEGMRPCQQRPEPVLDSPPRLRSATSSGSTATTRCRVSPRLLDEEDGPMLDLLEGLPRAASISIPSSAALRPDRERLAERFDRFLARA